jgi:Tfp pilus assembly protein PilO
MVVDKIIQLDRSKRRVMLLALVFIAAIALYRWILFPYGGQLFAAQQYKSTLDGAMHKISNLYITLKEKREKSEKMTKEFDNRQNELFTTDEVQRFFGSLQTIARKSGCIIQSVTSLQDGRTSPQNEQDTSGIVGKKTMISISGGYGDILRFLGYLQTYEHKIWIESFKLDTGGNTGKLKCQVVLTLYCIERLEAT